MKEANKDKKIDLNKERLLNYKIFSAAFSYPGSDFFKYFPQLKDDKVAIEKEYDQTFRNKGLWLYTTEYASQGTFQKAQHLSDIMGFYKAFGLELDHDRPDSLTAEFEFMHFLIFKTLYAEENDLPEAKEKIDICQGAQAKFFTEYIYEGAKEIAEKIIALNSKGVYTNIAKDMVSFLDKESKALLKIDKSSEAKASK
tara:strand:- start:3117 stop:3710 length:594 start_codon:yes stop_codon:yes gene_type:complete